MPVELKNLLENLRSPGSFRDIAIVATITIGAFALTRNPFTGPYALQMTLVALLAFLFYAYFSKKTRGAVGIKTFALLLATFIVFLVGSTGWFFSPFFFSLYLLAVLLAFIFSFATAASFVACLAGLFSVNIGEVDLAYDFLVVLSLVATIPLIYYLRREYLRLKEAEKEILILEEGKKEYRTKVEEILANAVGGFAANIRQPINNAKQLAYRLETLTDQEEITKHRRRIIASSEEALRLLKHFEEEATGEKLLSTPRTP